MRTQVWEDCDKLRCGTVPGLFDDNFGFEAYAKHVLNTRAMFEMDGSEGHLTNKTTSEVYGSKNMDTSACAHASSHLFNDVRLKNFIEIRPADALPTNVAVAYVSLIKGIFYCEKALAKTEEFLQGKCEKDIKEAKLELQKFGFDAKIYGKSASEVAETIIKIADFGLNEDEKHYLEPLKQIVSTRETLADAKAPLN